MPVVGLAEASGVPLIDTEPALKVKPEGRVSVKLILVIGLVVSGLLIVIV
ncbi:hypothetical protein CLOHAE12215_00065 [Clostridium haemolyticum]|nr:hypothetical protein CLOHAE12215_00065 [Clostridium haemolyticum]